MLYTIIKNHLKLMMRNKILMISLLIAPLGVIALISNEFKDMMAQFKFDKPITIGYAVEEDSPYSMYMDQVSKQSKEEQIHFEKYLLNNNKIEQVMKEKKFQAFIEIDNSEYILSILESNKSMNGIIEDIVTKLFEQLGETSASNTTLSSETYNNITKIDVTPRPNSVDYYGVAYISYFAMCGVVVIAMIVSSERKNRIVKRMMVTGVSRTNLYLGKFIPCAIGVFILMLSASVLASAVLDVHFGKPLAAIGILFLLSCASAAFGILSLYIVKGMAPGIIIVFSTTFYMAFFGGGFQCYMMNNVPTILRDSSPLYHVNKTIVEFKTLGSSASTIPCIIYLSAIIVVCSLLSLLVIKRGVEE